MKLFRKGSQGHEVRDIQSRLVEAGFLDAQCGEILTSSFGEETDHAVRSFQQQRGLMADGIVGTDTWRSLVEASRVLGSRFIYLREPPLRGDDVADLQRRLNALGFYSGKEDGIFSELTAVAVEEFQRNIGLPTDGIAGTRTIEALLRLSRVTKQTSVAAVRESEKGLPSGGIAGRRIMVDPGHGNPPDPGESGPSGLAECEVAWRIADLLVRALVAADALALHSRRQGEYLSEKERAERANELGVELVLSIHLNSSDNPDAGGSCTYYFESGNYRSPYGYRLANHLQDEMVSLLGLADCRAHGRAFPLLRWTRMPVVIIEPAFITNPAEEALLANGAFLEKVAGAIARATGLYFAGIKAPTEQ